jgi:hypothetical protein
MVSLDVGFIGVFAHALYAFLSLLLLMLQQGLHDVFVRINPALADAQAIVRYYSQN